MTGTLIASVPDVEMLKTVWPEFDFVDYEEAERLVKAAEDEWATVILVALRTGMRHGELIALRWEDVDLVAGRIIVRKNCVGGVIGTPKSGSRARSRRVKGCEGRARGAPAPPWAAAQSNPASR